MKKCVYMICAFAFSPTEEIIQNFKNFKRIHDTKKVRVHCYKITFSFFPSRKIAKYAISSDVNVI